MTHRSDDELLLNRYVDGEVTPKERETIENRLAAEPELRSQLADLVEFTTTLGIGLAETPVGEATARTTPRREMATVPWARSHRGLVAAAAVLSLAIVGVVGWWVASKRAPAARLDPYQVVDGMPAEVDKASLRSDVAEILDLATQHDRRLAIYGRWHDLPLRTIESLVWTIAPYEVDSKARAMLLGVFGSAERVTDYPALLERARAEWSFKELPPLVPLTIALSHHPGPETERLFAEILQGRQELGPKWFAERLPTIQSTFPTSPTICPLIVRALSDPEETVRAWAGLARAEIGQRDGVECARALLTSTTADVRRVSAMTIARYGWETDIAALLPLAHDPDPTVQAVARKALTKHKIPIPSIP